MSQPICLANPAPGFIIPLMVDRSSFPLPGAVLRRLAAFATLWLVLAGAAPDALAFGVPVAALATWMSFALLPAGPPLRLGRGLRALPHFLWRSVVGGVDVAQRAFHPRLPLDPGWAKVRVPLGGGARVALGAELSLMPGTLVAGSAGDRLLIHMLDRSQDIEGAVALEAGRLAEIAGAAQEASGTGGGES
ncbi:Na+/H+ antiporter subunit E [Plastorhodobacter daqingensis]|uniref:Na+/H+ antiporter subunit E n=1 Tax=Plastorhodobacter daqingensis TaxID=1387281 RepID=A0ABW2UMC9_9RHOB